MDSALSTIGAETTNIKIISAQKGNTLLDLRDSSIIMTVYLLGNMASPNKTRMASFLPSTEQFVHECELGEGYHGVVVKARDNVTGKTVAMKTLRSRPLH